MKKPVLCLALLSVCSMSAFAETGADILRVRNAMASRVGFRKNARDVRLEIAKAAESICGSAADIYKIELQVRVKGESFQTVKTYGVPAKLVDQLEDLDLEASIQDSADCG